MCVNPLPEPKITKGRGEAQTQEVRTSMKDENVWEKNTIILSVWNDTSLSTGKR